MMWLRFLLAPMAVLATLSLPTAVIAQDQTLLEQRAADIGKVFTGEGVYEDVFTPSFVNAVPKAQFDAITTQLTSQMGAYAGVYEIVPDSDNPLLADVRYRFGDMLANTIMQLSPEAPNQVAGFRLTGTSPILEEGETISDKVAELPGTTNLLFAKLDGSDPIEAHNVDVPLAMGSAFKLWVLSALVRDIEAGNRAWDNVVTLEGSRAPVGGMQNWPYLSPVTLHTLATMMISTSDNTATDMLINVLGRDVVEAELTLTQHSNPSLNLPFLTTRELMLLKKYENEGRWDYSALSEAEKRAALKEIDWHNISTEGAMALFTSGPQHIDIEWFATPRDLANVMQRLEQNIEARKILTVNKGFAPGVADSWGYVGFKGGSEPGVVNFTWVLVNDLKEPHILTMSWNNPEAEVDHAQFMGLAQEIMAANKQQRFMAVPAN